MIIFKYISEKYPGGAMTPEDFYLKTYNENLQENIGKSAKYLDMPYPIKSNTTLYIYIGIITVLIIILLYLIAKR